MGYAGWEANARHIGEILMQGGNNTESICIVRMSAQLGWMPWGKEGPGVFLHVQTPHDRRGVCRPEEGEPGSAA